MFWAGLEMACHWLGWPLYGHGLVWADHELDLGFAVPALGWICVPMGWARHELRWVGLDMT
jgi:hypothetical protein